MLRILKTSLLAITASTLFASGACAQYYDPNPQVRNHSYQPNAGFRLGARNGGINPNAGFGYGPVGAGVAAGLGRNGVGTGINTGVGPLGVTADAGIGRNGVGLRGAGGIGNTGAAFNGGVSGGGIGAGANARLFGFGPGASIGIGERGPGLGASLAFGPLGSLLIGSHRNTYPGAQQTAAHIYPNQNTAYYRQQDYGRTPYYQAAPVQQLRHRVVPAERHPTQNSSVSRCPQNWIC